MNEVKYERLHYDTRGGRFDPNSGRFSPLNLEEVLEISEEEAKRAMQELRKKDNKYFRGI